MATKTFTVIVEGTAAGTLNLVFVKLNGKKISMTSDPTGATWTNTNVTLTYAGPIDFFMSCRGFDTTTWDMSVQDNAAAAPCYKNNGVIGAPLADGTIIPGYSEIADKINC